MALTFWLALHYNSLRAQTFTAPLQASTTGTNPVDFEFRADGTMIAKGNLSVGSLLTGDQGAGTRLLWFPSLGALRVGGVSGTQWDSSNIGLYSVALGYNTSATGTKSIAMGDGSVASGSDSVALGRSHATGSYAAALGGGTASGLYSISLGGGQATGNGSTATSAALAFANATTAFAQSTASGYGATSFGRGTAAGTWSLASGISTTAYAYASTALGVYNVGGGTTTSWVATDPLFEVGNGTSTTHADALIVYKNGNVTAQGVIAGAPGGDIPMFTGY